MALAFGLPQFVVLCTPKAGTPHVEFSCSCDHHGTAESGAPIGDTDLGSPLARDDSDGCVHNALGVTLDRPPPKFAFVIDFELDDVAASVTAPEPLGTRATNTRPYATGPPRPGRTITMRRTIELRE